MNYRKIIKSYFSILVALSLTSQPKVFAQTNSAACEAELYQLSNFELADTPKLAATDVLDTDVEQIGNNQEQMLPTSSPYKSSATKELPKYWQMKVKESDSINNGDIKYTLIPSNQVNNPFKENKVELGLLGNPEEIETCSDDTIIIAGGISLKFSELSNLVPGTFQGQIEVCVQVGSNQCQ